jgi:hypothetical protein
MGIADLHEREGKQASDWEHTYAPCEDCAGNWIVTRIGARTDMGHRLRRDVIWGAQH